MRSNLLRHSCATAYNCDAQFMARHEVEFTSTCMHHCQRLQSAQFMARRTFFREDHFDSFFLLWIISSITGIPFISGIVGVASLKADNFCPLYTF